MSISYKAEFLENKNKIISCLDNAAVFMDEFGYDDRKNAIIKQKNDLENGEFTIVVVGEFSAGKSTFLNALMGKKILPSFTSETTATINFLRHKNCAKNGEEGCVYFSDSDEDKQIISRADENTISKYVSTRGDDVANTVHHLDLYMDSKFLEDNVTLVDSPGLNGVAKGHAELTKEQIQKSSASIFMFSARQPGSKTDFEVLADLSKRVSSIICVLNQIDAIKTSEGETVESVIKKLKQNYKEVMGDDVTSIPEIYPVSAYQALVGRDSNCTVQNGIGETVTLTDEERKKYEDSSRIREFEERLFRYLTQGEKAKASMSTPVSQLCQILKEIQGELEEEMQLLDGTIDETELENQIEALQEKKEQLETEIKEKHTEVKKSLQENKEEIIDRIKAEAEHLRTKLIRQLDNWEEIEDIEPENILRVLQRGVKTIAEEAEDEFVINNGRICDEYTDGMIEATISPEFKFKVSGELPPVDTVTVGIEEFQAEIRKLESKEEELKKVLDDTTTNMIERLEAQQKRESLEREITDKKLALETYEETSQAAIPSSRIYTERVEKARTIKKRKIFSDKVVYEWVDVEKVDSTERDEFKKERNQIINKKQKEIEKLEEELRKIPGSMSIK